MSKSEMVVCNALVELTLYQALNMFQKQITSYCQIAAWCCFAYLFAKLPLPEDSKVTFAVFKSSYKKNWIASGQY